MFNKRGQAVIFVIIALVIVAAIILYFAFPQALPGVSRGEVNPTAYLRDCIEPALDEVTELVYAQGGYSSPTHSLLYQGTEIQYLCYTDESYKPCKVMQPLLLQHVEQEVTDYVEPIARTCVDDLKEQYEREGYTVTATPGTIEVNYEPGSINVDFLSPMTVTKENTQTFQRFGVSVPSEMYDLLLTATSILQFESTVGDSETTLYIRYYPDLKVEKIKRDDDTIYTVSSVVTGESFTFATRSLVWPDGYGLEEL